MDPGSDRGSDGGLVSPVVSLKGRGRGQARMQDIGKIKALDEIERVVDALRADGRSISWHYTIDVK